MLIFATGLKITEGGTQSNNIVELANDGLVSTGLNARRATGLTAAESEKSFTRSENRWRGGRERGERRTRLGEKSSDVAFFVFFLPVQVVPVGQKIITHERDGDFFSFRIFPFGFIGMFFSVLLCRYAAMPLCRYAVLGIIFLRTYSTSKEKKYTPYLGYVRTHINRQGDEAHVASELFSP